MRPANIPLPEVAQRLTSAERILAICHVDPDGDAIGSLLGLGWLLAAVQGERRMTLACQDAIPQNLQFLPGCGEIVVQPPAEAWDLIVSVDASDIRRVGEPLQSARASNPHAPLLVIDHHITNAFFGDFHYVNPGAAATAEILTGLAEPLGVTITREAATCLLTGLLTDTLGFRTTNTTAATLATGMRLVEAGGNLAELAQRTLVDRPLAVLRLWGLALPGLRLDQQVVSVAISRDMRRAAGIPDEDTGELVSQLIAVNEARVAAVFNQVDGDQVKVSMRARRGYDVAQAALSLGGGGHPQAAGCTLPGSLEEVRSRVLPLLQAVAEQGEDL